MAHRPRQLVTRYAKDPVDGDGQIAHVYMTALPAKFYEVVAVAGVNSAGEPMPAFMLSFGTDMDSLVHQIAKAISTGMLSLSAATVPVPQAKGS